MGTNHHGERFLFSNKLECCRDRTEEDQTQWLTVNNFRYLYNHALTWVGKLNLSWPDNQQTRIDDGRFTETDIGLAYLPVSNDCLSMLGKYTYLYDLNSAVPADPTTDARSHMVSVEGIYDFIWRWELGAKLAWKRGEMRAERDAGDWYRKAACGSTRPLSHDTGWDDLLEYRWLDVKEADDSHQGHWWVSIGTSMTM